MHEHKVACERNMSVHKHKGDAIHVTANGLATDSWQWTAKKRCNVSENCRKEKPNIWIWPMTASVSKTNGLANVVLAKKCIQTHF